MSKSSPPKPNVRHFLGIGLLTLVLASLPVISYFGHQRPWILLLIVLFYIVIAFVLRSRLVICTLAGILLGSMFGNTAKSGSLESQVRETIGRFVAGVIIGFTIGLAWDNSETQPLHTKMPIRKKR